jgi:hypothetical protein
MVVDIIGTPFYSSRHHRGSHFQGKQFDLGNSRVQANGANLTTIEGLAQDGNLHAVQEAFWNNHGLQCGYCTSGMIMTVVELLQRNPNPTNQEIRGTAWKAISAAAPDTRTL